MKILENKKKRNLIIAIAAVTLLVIICIVIVLFSKGKNNSNNETQQNANTAGIYPVDIQGDNNVKTNPDGTKENISEQLKQTQTLKNAEISNITLTYVNGVSIIKADVKNTTDKTTPELKLNAKIKDDTGKVVREVPASVYELGSGESKPITISITTDAANAASIEFSLP